MPNYKKSVLEDSIRLIFSDTLGWRVPKSAILVCLNEGDPLPNRVVIGIPYSINDYGMIFIGPYANNKHNDLTLLETYTDTVMGININNILWFDRVELPSDKIESGLEQKISGTAAEE